MQPEGRVPVDVRVCQRTLEGREVQSRPPYHGAYRQREVGGVWCGCMARVVLHSYRRIE